MKAAIKSLCCWTGETEAREEEEGRWSQRNLELGTKGGTRAAIA